MKKKLNLGYAELETPMGLSSKKGHFWNSKEILRFRNLTPNDVEVIVKTTDEGESVQKQA